MKKNVLASFFGVVAFALSSSLFVSCDPSDSNVDPTDDFKNLKYTITVDSPIDASDEVHFNISGSDGQPTSQLFKIDNETLDYTVTLYSGSFTTTKKTYVIESVKPLQSSNLSVSLHNNVYENPKIPVNDLKFSYKVEVNGKTVVNVVDEVLSGIGATYEKNYEF